jgi:hypothetical protein
VSKVAIVEIQKQPIGIKVIRQLHSVIPTIGVETFVVTTNFVDNRVLMGSATNLGHGLRGVFRGNNVFKDRKPRKENSVVNWEEEERLKKSMVRDNSTHSENIDSDKRAIHIHGGMEHDLARYAKCYSCAST